MLKKGELIKWFENYDDQVCCKDSGLGIIVELKKHKVNNFGTHLAYKVYRNKHKDFCWFQECDLEPR